MYQKLSAIIILLALLAGCGTGQAPAQNNPPTGAQSGNLTPRPTVAPPQNAQPTSIPTQPAQPTAIPATPTNAATERKLTFSEPAAGATVASPLHIAGGATLMPFEGALAVEVYDNAGALLGQTSIIAEGEYGGPATWSADIEFSAPAADQPGTIVIYETSPKDGSVLVKAALPVQLKGAGDPPAGGDPAEATISLVAPGDGPLASPIQITGSANFTPFEKTFGAAVYDSEGNLIGQAGIQAEGEYGGPSTFAGEIEFTAPATERPGKVVVYEASAKDGSILAQAEIPMKLAAHESGEHIALPAHNASVGLPLHVEVSGVGSFTSYVLRLTFDDGTVLEGAANTPASSSGHPASGATNLAANLDWATESAPPNPPSQHARLDLMDRTGAVLTSRDLYVLNRADEALMPVKVYFTLGEQLQEVTRYVPRSPAVATAALRELSWGPAGNEVAAAGMDSALPRPETMAESPQFQDGWAARVYLQSIRISDGTATVDWSPEMAAWGGGSARLAMLRQQVEATLGQFPTIKNVVMTVNGSEEVLQP